MSETFDAVGGFALQEVEEERAKAWEMLPGEPAEQYDLFRRYLMQGAKRKMTAVARSEGVTTSVSTLHRYARRWRWRERAAYWDRQLAKRLDEVMFQHEYETGMRNLKKIDAEVDKLAERIRAANMAEIDKAMALSMFIQNMDLFLKAMEMETKLLGLGHRESCPWCNGR